MYFLKQSTAITVPIFCFDDNGDAVTGLVDGDFTKRISKNGSAFGDMTVTITEMESGWYSVPIGTSHSDIVGDLSIYFTATGIKQVNLKFQVSVRLLDDLATSAGVWDIDATAHQTQGTFGQAIGDPAADTNTIYKAVVTDATGATVGADTTSALSRIPSALSGDGFMKADLKSIDDELTNGYNATLNLKMLDINNTTGIGLRVRCSVGNGIYIEGAVNGVYIQGNSGAGDGIYVQGEKHGIESVSATDGHGIYGVGSTGNGLQLEGVKSLNAPQDIAVSDGSLTLAAIAAAVWTNATRTLSTFGTLIADIWAYVTRTITGGTITTNSDKTGYSLTSAYDPAKTASQDSDMVVVLANVVPLTFDSDSYVLSHPMTSVIVGTNGDKTGYSLTSAYDPAKTASQDSDMFDVLGYVSGLTFDSDSRVFANAAVSLTSDDIQSIVDALSFPTADENATTLLKYDLSTVTGEAARSPLNALRKLRNKVSFATGTLSIKKEDDVTNAYTQAVTQDSDQEPFKSIG
jgi:hypothetical protein